MTMDLGVGVIRALKVGPGAEVDQKAEVDLAVVRLRNQAVVRQRSRQNLTMMTMMMTVLMLMKKKIGMIMNLTAKAKNLRWDQCKGMRLTVMTQEIPNQTEVYQI